ncbi:MAG TPA: phosphoribosyltransferase family protein [Desulfobulbales bacterium]|nr:phosphoribosyltransferase family protein [Desulfobulbales bacterium]
MYSFLFTYEQIDRQVKTTMATIEQRHRKFRYNKPFPDIAARHVILVDDGLASGYTMRAAIAYLRKRKPGSITIAVPTGAADTVKMLLREVDTICCLNIYVDIPKKFADKVFYNKMSSRAQ